MLVYCTAVASYQSFNSGLSYMNACCVILPKRISCFFKTPHFTIHFRTGSGNDGRLCSIFMVLEFDAEFLSIVSVSADTLPSNINSPNAQITTLNNTTFNNVPKRASFQK